MSLQTYLSDRLLQTAAIHRPELVAEKKAELLYGFLAFYLTVTKFLIMTTAAWWLDLMPEYGTVLTVFMLIRPPAGGIHADRSWLCLLESGAVFFGTIFLAVRYNLPPLLLTAMSAVSLVLYLLYAPADTVNKPIRSTKLRRKLKKRSLILALVGMLAASFLAADYRELVILAIFAESLLITPAAYRLTKTKTGEYYEKTVQ